MFPHTPKGDLAFCDSIVAIEAFQRRVLVKNRVLRPSGYGIQLPDPDARNLCRSVRASAAEGTRRASPPHFQRDS